MLQFGRWGLFHGLNVATLSQKKFSSQVGETMIDGEFVRMASGAVTRVGKFKEVTCVDILYAQKWFYKWEPSLASTDRLLDYRV